MTWMQTASSFIKGVLAKPSQMPVLQNDLGGNSYLKKINFYN